MKSKADDTLNHYCDFLSPGIWKSSYGLMSLYKKGYKKFSQTENAFTMRNYFYNSSGLSGSEHLANFLFYRFYRFKKSINQSDVQGQVLTINSHKTAAKIVNIDQNYLVTVYSNANIMLDYLTKRDIWTNAGDGNCFHVPDTLERNFERLYVKEAFLTKSTFSVEEGFETIVHDYLNLFNIIGGESVRGNITEEQENKIIEIAKKLGIENIGNRALLFMRSEKYRINLSHGDLFKFNLIKSNGIYYYIDFEIVGKRCFFFDWFKYMAVSYRYGKNLLNSYMNGEYDNYFEKLFKCNDVEYDPNEREVYLFVFEMISTDFGRFTPLWNYKEIWDISNNK